jgi:hypothetical protein
MKPVVGRCEAQGLNTAEVAAALYSTVNKTCAFEDLDVLGGGGKRHAEGCSEFANVVFAGGECAEHGAARGIGESVKDGIERLGGLLNHVVEDREC